MNADEARKCLLVARRLLQEAEAGTGGPSKANAALERALKYAEKSKRLDAAAVGGDADALIARINATTRTFGAEHHPSDGRRGNGASSASTASGAGRAGGGFGSSARGASQRPQPAAGRVDRAEEVKVTKGTPEQEALMAKVRRTSDYYEILGVAKSASDAEIKKGYRKLALKLHPDKCQATGAEEVFKSVSKAFACLSDADKRAAYDRYGTEDPASMASGMHRRGGQGAPGHAGGFYGGDDIDPAEIFNAFFGGGFPGGPGVRFRTYHHGGGARRARAAHRDRGGDEPLDLLKQLFHLLPLMLVFIMYALAPGQEEHYALNRSPTFSHTLTTHRLEVPFYVKSVDGFEESFPESTRQRQRVEHDIERSHISSLEHNCLFEQQQRQRMYRFGTRAQREHAKEMELHSCVKLQSIRARLRPH